MKNLVTVVLTVMVSALFLSATGFSQGGNQPPVLDPIGPQWTMSQVNLSFSVSASDPDGTIPMLSASSLPSGAAFVDNGDGTGLFDWTPTLWQYGLFNVIFYADDGRFIDSEVVSITVIAQENRPPILDSIGPQTTKEGVNLSFGVSAIDPDETIPMLSSSSLPSGAVFLDHGTGSGEFSWTPDFNQAGIYSVTFCAHDGVHTDCEVVLITVEDAEPQAQAETLYVNASTSTVPIASEIECHGEPDGAEAGISVRLVGKDSHTWNFEFENSSVSDLTILSAEMFLTHRQSGCLDDSLVLEYFDGTSFIPFELLANVPTVLNTVGPYAAGALTSSNQLDNFQVRLRSMSKTRGPDSISYFVDAIQLQLEYGSNMAPVLDSIGPQLATEGINLNFGVSATDPDGTIPALTTSILPVGASFVDGGDGTGIFDWTPDFTQAGMYNVIFFAADGFLVDTEVVTITVQEVGNQGPILDPIGPQTTQEGVNLNFAVSATDPDGTIPFLGTSILPVGATFADNGDGTGLFDWTPDLTQGGTYSITFYATDGMLADFEVVPITVNESDVTYSSSGSQDNLPDSYSLDQNYPNPFNPTTRIGFAMPEAANVRVEIFNLLGQKVETLLDSRMEAGHHFVDWNASRLSSGVYFYILQAGDFSDMKKMLLLK